MRWTSLRSRTLVVSTLVAVLIAGGTSLATYAIMMSGMRQASMQHAERVALEAETEFVRAVADASRIATGTSGGSSMSGRISAARQILLGDLTETFAQSGAAGAPLALYDESLRPVWASSPDAFVLGDFDTRRRAQVLGVTVRTQTGASTFFGGLFGDPRLGDFVYHIPSVFPSGARGVLVVKYSSVPEETVINDVRWSMLGLLFLSAFLMVALMQTSMEWVLRLVDNLRRGADSIDAGRLNERLLVKGENEIAALAQSVNGLIGRLERRSDAQARFVADASHELATPVAGIRGYTGILRAWGADDPRVRDEAIDAIDRESRRMARLTGDLLNLLHADQGLVLKTERFDVNALARQQLATSASRWLDKDIEYIGPDEAPLVMVGDPDRVEDVFSILLDNASKYTPFQGHVTVTTRRRRETVTIEVADTGQGIPERDLEHIFDRFFRSEVSRATVDGGFGLGLAIAKSIVVSMGGEISVVSTVGRGTTFAVKLPRGRA